MSLPLGIQAIISFAMGATMVTSIYILIAFVVLGTWLVGFFRVKVMEIIEKIQQKIFVEYAISFRKLYQNKTRKDQSILLTRTYQSFLTLKIYKRNF